jgi:hypothetical protein
MTHTELQQDLARALRAQRRLVLTEVDLCSRWANVQRIEWDGLGGHEIIEAPGAPRIDVLRVEESYTRFEVFAYECKASRGDFLSDIRSGKWRQYLPYCHRLYFAVDSGVCDAVEVPAECGLLMRRKAGNGWRTLRQAPRPSAEHELQWSAETFLAVLFSLGRQPGDDKRQKLIKHAQWLAFNNPGKLIGQELGRLVRRGRDLEHAERSSGSNLCVKCGQWLPSWKRE